MPKITRRFTVRPAVAELNLSMSPYFSGYHGEPAITIRMNGSETIEGPNGHAHKSYQGLIEMGVVDAFRLIGELNGAILDAYKSQKAAIAKAEGK